MGIPLALVRALGLALLGEEAWAPELELEVPSKLRGTGERDAEVLECVGCWLEGLEELGWGDCAVMVVVVPSWGVVWTPSGNLVSMSSERGSAEGAGRARP